MTVTALLPIRRCIGIPLMRLFCLPHAGGAASAYLPWADLLPSTVELCAVQLPGRGGRSGEPARGRAAELAAEIAEGVAAEADLPYAFFGHSMGGLLAFEAAQLLAGQGAPAPMGLMVSSARSPDRWDRPGRRFHTGSDAELIGMLRVQGATPPELFEFPDLLELALPPLRADLEVCETYVFAERPPLTVPIAVFGGSEDPGVTAADLAGWRRHSIAPVSVRIFGGDHFYHTEALPQLLDVVVSHLDSWAGSTGPAPTRRSS
ncbi:thioesterase II family protein [Micromonospora echinofusca]|uniref:Alpha/beta fold hydrolase n=1 Tax=Micromonospora echinofusca TaxID=47858 RepID=A0ABS3VIT7_MICEH|nr:alpha/beta fold hydrolase [Micromonospora echinofusca]MBO4204434.1 alpha/beta fold hydrolase [Micromonospora echinofusca]